MRTPFKFAAFVSLLALGLLGFAALIFWYSRNNTNALDERSQVGEDAGNSPLRDRKHNELLPAPHLWDPVGANWRLRVKQYQACSTAAVKHPKDWVFKPLVLAEFDVLVTVLPSRHQGDHTIARLCFTPDTGAPDHMAGQRFVLEIDKSDGFYVDMKPQKFGSSIEIPFHGAKYLWDQLYGIRINWIVRNRARTAIPQAKTEDILPSTGHSELVKWIEPVKIATRSGSQCDAVRITLVDRFTQDVFEHTVDKRSFYYTTQIWVPGERWWRSFKRILSGTIDLEATLVEEK